MYMDATTCLLTRRSIRNFVSKKVDDCIIDELLHAGMCAPSTGNQQPWQFLVVDSRDILNRLPEFLPNGAMLSQAQKAIVVCGDISRETYKGYWMVDCSAATQNMLLAAHAQGLGACWLGVYPRKERIAHLQELFQMPQEIIPFSVIALGYTDVKSGPVDRFEKSRIHYNTW